MILFSASTSFCCSRSSGVLGRSAMVGAVRWTARRPPSRRPAALRGHSRGFSRPTGWSSPARSTLCTLSFAGARIKGAREDYKKKELVQKLVNNAILISLNWTIWVEENLNTVFLMIFLFQLTRLHFCKRWNGLCNKFLTWLRAKCFTCYLYINFHWRD